jgi:hypothetical protein
MLSVLHINARTHLMQMRDVIYLSDSCHVYQMTPSMLKVQTFA